MYPHERLGEEEEALNRERGGIREGGRKQWRQIDRQTDREERKGGV